MKKYILLLVALLFSIGAWANDEFITDVMVIGGTQSEIDIMKPFYEADGWTIIDSDLNAGCGSKSDYIYLLYKTASDTITSPDFITEFLLLKTGADAPDSIVNSENNRTYYLVDYDGGSNFRSTKGDLNSKAHGDYIHLYYSKYTDTYDIDYRVIKSIYFDNVPDGAVTSGDGTAACDLNSGAGGDYIYMHVEQSQGWKVVFNSAGTECYINGFEGPRAMIPSVTVPYEINHAVLLGLYNDTFSGFTNLETLLFFVSSKISQMPSLKGCSKFEHVNSIPSHGDYISEDCTPLRMTNISNYAFAGTAIKKITFTNVNHVGADAFSTCDQLVSVTFGTSPVLIENGAFSNISSDCQVSYPGALEDWNPMMYMYSPGLVVKNSNSWACGWCGSDNDSIQNHLYWTLKDSLVKIDCATDIWDTNPAAQVITNHNWMSVGVSHNVIKLSHVYLLRPFDIFYAGGLKEIYLDSTLDSIAEYAIAPDGNTSAIRKSLQHIWFDGTQQQWESVRKNPLWIIGFESYKLHWHCMVTYNANGHGRAPDPVSILWSNNDKLDEPTAPSAEGYVFTGWYREAACINRWNFDDVIPGDMTLYAGWQKVYVTGDIDGSGKVDGNDLNILINIMLGNLEPTDQTVKGNPNIDGQGGIDGSDLNMLINIILGK